MYIPTGNIIFDMYWVVSDMYWVVSKKTEYLFEAPLMLFNMFNAYDDMHFSSRITDSIDPGLSIKDGIEPLFFSFAMLNRILNPS